MICYDLGGIENKEGKVLKKNLIFRSAELKRVPKNLARKFKKIGLKIIDLRTKAEISAAPDKDIGVENINLPLTKSETLGMSVTKTKIQILRDLVPMNEMYQKILTDEFSLTQLKKILRLILNSKTPILYHCTKGKDRTGIVTIILLNLLDFNEEKIYNNYIQINKKLRHAARFYAFIIFLVTWNKKLSQKVYKYLTVDKENYDSLMDTINAKHGGMKNFISKTLGITAQEKLKFKSKVLN